LRHRHVFPWNLTVLGELGYVSDRNVLEQYFEDEFDEEKDIETLLYGTQSIDNVGWSLLGRVQLNEFENTTEWLPKGDLFILGEPLLGGWLTYSSHSSAGYGNLEPADPPDDPNDVFTPLPFVADVEGAVLMSRHELDAPFNLGPLHFVPYALGEAAFWEQDLNGDQLTRLMSSVGVRSSVLFWRTYPYVQSRLFNLNGLAHKIRLEADYGFTSVDEPLGRIAQYNEFDDNAQERFRQRFVTNTFTVWNGRRFVSRLPPQFEPRNYAVRTGAGLPVSAPYHELVDDQQVLRLAIRQRLQTKTGPPERLRIRDWMTLDLEASFFPQQDRDNFGEDFGLLGGYYRWHISDRTSILASAEYDLFDDAQQL
ncbi:MAG: organic solvent tolerance protein OstA, partial [Planctomycetaceae bacterium]